MSTRNAHFFKLRRLRVSGKVTGSRPGVLDALSFRGKATASTRCRWRIRYGGPRLAILADRRDGQRSVVDEIEYQPGVHEHLAQSRRGLVFAADSAGFAAPHDVVVEKQLQARLAAE